LEEAHELERGLDSWRTPPRFGERDSDERWLGQTAGNRNDGPDNPERKRITTAIVGDAMARSRSLRRDLRDGIAGAVRSEIGFGLSRLSLRGSMLDRPEQDAHGGHAENIQSSTHCLSPSSKTLD
jgi:hypothetical protein